MAESRRQANVFYVDAGYAETLQTERRLDSQAVLLAARDSVAALAVVEADERRAKTEEEPRRRPKHIELAPQARDLLAVR